MKRKIKVLQVCAVDFTARNLINYEPVVDVYEGLQRAIEYFRENGKRQSKNS